MSRVYSSRTCTNNTGREAWNTVLFVWHSILHFFSVVVKRVVMFLVFSTRMDCVELHCSAYDFYSYNSPGPASSDFSGERSLFHLQVSQPGLYTFTCDQDVRKVIIVGHNGRVISSKGYKQGTVRTFKAPTPGLYLFKLWTQSVPNYYTVCWKTKEQKPTIEYAKQLIYCPGMSNSDGSIFERGTTLRRKNGKFYFSFNTRLDRMPTTQR